MRHKIPSVLIVDDEPLNLRISAECLATDYTIYFARSGEEALKLLESKIVDIILLDVNMPGMDGFETAQKIYTLYLNRSIPIIYLTADTSEETISKAFDNGASDYIIKPFKQKELLARVKNWIETERLKASQRQLIEKNEHLMGIIDTHVAYIKTDTNGIITEISQNFSELISSRRDDSNEFSKKIIGKNINILKSDKTDKSVYEHLWEALQKGESFTCEIEDSNFYGGTNWFRVSITPDIDENGEIQGYIAFYHNIDEKIRFEHDAYTDYLTGLYNRTKFDKELKSEIERSRRYKIPFSIILADIDYFKDVNDTYGHETGDIVLKEIAQILTNNLRHNDILARWGGEEFIILSPHTDRNGAAELAENLRSKIQGHRFSSVGEKTASFGVVQFQDTMDEKALFKSVDTALYTSKTEGRNKVTVYI